MFSKYFQDFNKKVIKKGKASAKSAAAKGTIKSSAKKKSGPAKKGSAKIDRKILKEMIMDIIPSPLIVGDAKPIDSTGFSPDTADFIVYREYCRNIQKIMGGYIPAEFVYGAYFVVDKLDRASLQDVLKKIKVFKKLNQYTEEGNDTRLMIPAFVISMQTSYSFLELKNDIVNYYLAENIEHNFELDILMILKKGIVIKNWREKRSFIALETNEDSSMWFFILMNEYLEGIEERDSNIRNYVKRDAVYQEY